jgi:2-C-methyl-D-erythritol 4-phosphate cytidylyltransferase
MNTAIIVAAGSGTRFKSTTPKQFVEINGKPLLIHTLERFEAARSVDSVIVVLPEDRIDEFEAIIQRFQPTKIFAVVSGGATRAESVRNGLDAIALDEGVVAVHDGARPLVTPDEIDATIEKAEVTGAACLVAPVTDTIKTINGKEIANTLERDKLRRALTPQAFHVELLRKAFEQAELNEAVTDECYLVEKLGHPISIVEGSARNIKITQADDLITASEFLKLG